MKVKLHESNGDLGSPSTGGKFRIRIIEGDRWGSSGYYPASVIKRDGPTVFREGTQMFMDHPTFSEEFERPERSVRDLVGVIASKPEWNEESKALEADAQFFSQYQDMLHEVAPHIGVSINAYALSEYGEIDGQEGQVIKEFLGAQSVDLVTKAGAGGAILSTIESAMGGSNGAVRQRSGQQQEEKKVADTTIDTATLTALTTAMTSLTEALTKEQQDRAAREAAEAASKDEQPEIDPLSVAQALAEAKLPKSYAARVVEAVKGGKPVEEAVTEAKADLDDVLKEVGADKPGNKSREGHVGAPQGSTSLGDNKVDLGFGVLDLSESALVTTSTGKEN